MSKTKYVVGVDVGTTSCRTMVFDIDGRIMSKCAVEYKIETPRPGWAEQDPNEWWTAVAKTLKEAVGDANLDSKDIMAIGVTGQQPSPVFVGEDGEVLGNSLIWMDRRTSDQCRQIEEVLGVERVYEITGQRVDPISTASKILWVRHYLPEVFRRVHKVLQPKDFVIFRLTGEIGSDYASSAATQLLNLRMRTWSSEIIEALDIPDKILPTLHDSTAIIGRLRKTVADMTGLSEGTPVVCGAGDTTVSAVGSRVVIPGRVSVNIGTSSDVMACLEEPVFDRERRIGVYPHAVPDSYITIAGSNTSGACLRWFRDALCAPEKHAAEIIGVDVYEMMNTMVKDVEPGGGGLIFLPYLLGERSPIFDPKARGVLFGMSLSHTKGNLVRAIMEGVAFSIRHRLEITEQLKADLAMPTLIVAGGASNSPVWCQIIADVTGKEVQVLASGESTCAGIALLAGVSMGIYTSIESACDHVMPVMAKVRPLPQHVNIYSSLYDKYKDLYNCTRQLMV